MWFWIMSAMLVTSVIVNCAYFVNGRPKWLVLAQWREAYRHGIVAGYAKCERKWRHRKAVELYDAGRRSDARPDAGPPAHVSSIKFHSGH